MIRNGFRASPADYRGDFGPKWADPRTIGKWVGGGLRVAPDRAAALMSLQTGRLWRRGPGGAHW